MLERLIDALGGLASTAELAAAGFARPYLRDAISRRRIVRVRQGWYARAGIVPTLLAASRVGGRATCGSLFRGMGVWVARDDGLHVAVAPNACRLRDPRDSRRRLDPDAGGVRVHWDDGPGRSRLRVEPLQGLRDLAFCASLEELVATADSLLRVRPDLGSAWPERLTGFPSSVRTALELADGICESGTETYFWLRMLPRLHFFRRQVAIPGIGRVDFLIGDRLVVEIDGAAHHTDPASFERDRRRDALLSALGYRVLRFSYRQVVHDWLTVEAAVLAAVARLDHV